MEEEVPTSHKREREDYDELSISPEQKRLRSDLILDIFDDDTDAGSEDGLASVMKSLEEEIGLPSPIDPPASDLPLDSGDALQPDLGYLFEASDDELGLPPTVASSEEDGVVEVSDRAEADAGFGQIWGFADELPECYDGFDYAAFRPDESDSVAGGDVVVLGGDLFGYADEFYAPTDLTDLSWRSESLPAV